MLIVVRLLYIKVGNNKKNLQLFFASLTLKLHRFDYSSLGSRSYDLTGFLAILINGPDDHSVRDFSPTALLLVLLVYGNGFLLVCSCCTGRK